MSRNLRGISRLLLAVSRRNVYLNFRSLYIGAEHPTCFLRRHSDNSSVFNLRPPPPTNPIAISASYTSSIESHRDAEHDPESDDDDDEVTGRNAGDLGSSCDLEIIMDILQTPSVQEKHEMFEQSGVNVTPRLMADVLSMTGNDWEAAFNFFRWAAKQPDYELTRSDYHWMIAILGKFKKFDTAWALIEDMRASSLVTPQTIVIMIRKYAAAGDVLQAIDTFYSLRRFNFEIGKEEFESLLTALCRFNNVKDAEHLLFSNKEVFPHNTRSFNIILKGWCCVTGKLREGKRIWRDMEERGIMADADSYAIMMAGHSKFGNLKKVLRFYEKMKVQGIKPNRNVYNRVIHALARERRVKEVRGVMLTMEEEGFTPDSITYNSLIMALCKLSLFDEAQQLFDEMLERGLQPTHQTYHTFFSISKSSKEVFELLHRMNTTGCRAKHDTYVILIKKFCARCQFENVYKLLADMRKNGLDHNRKSYSELIHGMFLLGRSEEAHKYYLEMKEKHFSPEPNIDALFEDWRAPLQAKKA